MTPVTARTKMVMRQLLLTMTGSPSTATIAWDSTIRGGWILFTNWHFTLSPLLTFMKFKLLSVKLDLAGYWAQSDIKPSVMSVGISYPNLRSWRLPRHPPRRTHGHHSCGTSSREKMTEMTNGFVMSILPRKFGSSYRTHCVFTGRRLLLKEAGSICTGAVPLRIT